jgi:hypothetical protein
MMDNVPNVDSYVNILLSQTYRSYIQFIAETVVKAKKKRGGREAVCFTYLKAKQNQSGCSLEQKLPVFTTMMGGIPLYL